MYVYARYRSASDTSVVPTSPIAPRRSERLLALRAKSKETSTTSLSDSKATKEGIGGKGESSKTVVKGKRAEDNSTTTKLHDKQTTSKRATKKSQSESDLTPKQQKRRRVGSPEDKQDLSKDKIQRTSSSRVTGTTSANLLQNSSKKVKTSVSEPLLTSPKGKVSGGQDKGKKTTTKENKTLRKGKSSTGASTSGVTTRQLRKLRGRNLTAEMSSDE